MELKLQNETDCVRGICEADAGERNEIVAQH